MTEELTRTEVDLELEHSPSTNMMLTGLNQARTLAKWMASNGSVPNSFMDLKTKQPRLGDIVSAFMVGAGLGLNPGQSLQQLYCIYGKVGMDATAMRARAVDHPDVIFFAVTEATDTSATVTCKRKSWGDEIPAQSVTVTIEEAYKAKWGMSQWKNRQKVDWYWPEDSAYMKTPSDLLVARATSRACRRYVPEAIAGAQYTTQELADENVVEAEFEDVVDEVKQIGTDVSDAVVATMEARKDPEKTEAESAEWKKKMDELWFVVESSFEGLSDEDQTAIREAQGAVLKDFGLSFIDSVDPGRYDALKAALEAVGKEEG